MSHFCLLKDPDSYAADNWDLLVDSAAREYWFNHFDEGFAEAMGHASAMSGAAQKRIRDATEAFRHAIAALRSDPASLPSGKLNVLALDNLFGRVIREHQLDPYTDVKARANAEAADLYLPVVRELHAMPDEEKWLHLIQCVLAGNLFDHGAMRETPLAGKGPEKFLEALESLQPRPWLVDDYDRLAESLLKPPPLQWSKAVVFIDNSGADFVLGVMPLVRELALHGVQIVLAANEGAALNDVTADEAVGVVEDLAGRDPDLLALVEAQMFEVVSTGTSIPLLDLSEVSEELNAAAGDADFVLLEGMGRAVETNFDAAFRVDSLKLAQIKNVQIAAHVGGEMYDCVCGYAPAAEAAS